MPCMGKKKTDYHRHKAIGFRLEPKLASALRDLAEKNRRSPTQQLSLILEEYLEGEKAKHPPTGKLA